MSRLPESARRVFQAIIQEGPVTHAGLREATGIPPRTIRYAVRRLKDEELIDTRCSLEDCRTCYFFVHPQHIDAQALQRLRDEASTHDVVVQSWPTPKP